MGSAAERRSRILLRVDEFWHFFMTLLPHSSHQWLTDWIEHWQWRRSDLCSFLKFWKAAKIHPAGADGSVIGMENEHVLILQLADILGCEKGDCLFNLALACLCSFPHRHRVCVSGNVPQLIPQFPRSSVVWWS